MKLQGVNIGGFLSQIEKISDNHYSSFINENDFKRIKNWGFNTVRFPIDSFVLADFTKENIINEKIEKVIKNCIEWAKKYGLFLILDLHKAPGHSFDHNESEANDIWNESSKSRKEFLIIWEFLSKTFGKEKNVIFEILNEPTAPIAELWNKLVTETIPIIRKNAPTNPIIVESNMWGHSDTFTELQVFEDQNIIYSFHFYEPILVTHQQAEWFRIIQKYYPGSVEYPGNFPHLGSILKQMEHDESEHDFYLFKNQTGFWDINRLDDLWKPVIEFQKKNNVPILLGEFGCIGYAKPEIRQKWLKDIMTLVKKYNFSFTYWNYKNLHFGIIDESSRFKSNPNYNEQRIDTKTLDILQFKV